MRTQHMMSVAGSNIGLGPLPFNLHIKDSLGRLILYGRKGVDITPELRDSIQRTSRSFFISMDDIDSYLDYSLGHVEMVIRNPRVSIAAKSSILKEAGRKIFTKISQDHLDARTIGYSKRFTESVVDLVLGSPDAYETLLSMSGQRTYLFDHALNSCTFCILIGLSMFEKDDVTLFLLGLGGLLHDIGMASIDSRILDKPGRLSREERMRVENHPRHGYEILSEHEISPEVLAMVLQHHERQDGSGYPGRLSGNEIDQYAAIVAVADVYDALTSERSYRSQLKPLAAIVEMLRERQKYSVQALEALMHIVLKNEELVTALLARTA